MIVFDNHVVAIEKNDGQYEEILRLINHAPQSAMDGYVYMLRADTLEWELVELPPMPEPEDAAAAADYEAALNRLGVDV